VSEVRASAVLTTAFSRSHRFCDQMHTVAGGAKGGRTHCGSTAPQTSGHGISPLSTPSLSFTAFEGILHFLLLISH
jgi:hypothetical protein